MEEQPWYTTWYVKGIVITVVVVFIYIKIRPYIYHVLDTIETIRSLINMILSFSENVSKTVVDETSIGSKLIVNKLSKPIPEPSEGKSGYCLVGEWKGVRSCVKVDNTPCSSQLYSTQQQCVNPSLR